MLADSTDGTQPNANTRRAFLGLGTAVAVLGFNRLAYAQDAAAFYTQLGNATIKDGMEEEALAIFAEMAETHRANSPELLVYLIHRSTSDPLRLVTFEVFRDAASARATAGGPAMLPFYRRLQQVLQSTENVQLERVLGYLR
jgi:quinol monooxygenase YgiN